MSVKTYGIYIAYAPTIDLRGEGLGRYLASFLRGAAERRDVDFVIACPSWAQIMLDELFELVRRIQSKRESSCGRPLILNSPLKTLCRQCSEFA